MGANASCEQTRKRPRAEIDGKMDARTGRKRGERRWQWELKGVVSSISGKFRSRYRGFDSGECQVADAGKKEGVGCCQVLKNGDTWKKDRF